MTEAWPAALNPRDVTWQLISYSQTGGQTVAGNEQIIATAAQHWLAKITVPVFNRVGVLAYRGLMARLAGRQGTVAVPACTSGKPSGITASLSSAAALNATQLAISTASNLKPGYFLSLPDQRLHTITGVISHVGAVWTVAIEPWTRAAYAAGAAVEFNSPVALMRLASDEAGGLELEQLRFGNPTLDLVEAF